MDYQPTARLEVLRQRAELLRAIRAFFDQRDFWEVETPVLSADTVVDRHIDPIPVVLFDDPRVPRRGRQMWLQTSPEFGMKRLLAAGATAIYQITRAFRGGEVGGWHNPEFTMLEWYRVGDDYGTAMRLLSELCERLVPYCGPPQRLSYRDAVRQFAQIDPFQARTSELRAAAERLCTSVPSSLDPLDRDSWLDLLIAEIVSPQLGREQPTILFDFPASQAALAQIRAEDHPVAERFELFIRGLEIANGYHELLTADILRHRQTRTNQQRQQDGKPALPETNRLLEAMEAGIPPCSGVALGVDRLLMAITGAERISDVIAFPVERA